MNKHPWLSARGLIDVENPPIAGFGAVSGNDGLTIQTVYDMDLTDNVGLDNSTGISVTNPLGGTYTVSLSKAITQLADTVAKV
jgi:hypothetical protein